MPVRSAAGLEGALPDVDRVIVDLTARAYDGVEAIALAHAAGRPVLAVGQHDDAETRRRALAAGAERVQPYRLLFEDGPRQMARWLAGDPACSRHPDSSGVATMITSRPSIPAERYRDRMTAARDLAAEAGFAAVLVGTGADMHYLAGYPASSLERLTMLVIPTDGDWALVAPRLEATPARACPPAAAGLLPVVPWEEGSDAHALVAEMVRSLDRRPPDPFSIAVSDDLPARHLLRLQERLTDATFALASPILGQLRIVKDDDEIALLTEAAHAADRVVAQIAGRPAGRADRGGCRA